MNQQTSNVSLTLNSIIKFVSNVNIREVLMLVRKKLKSYKMKKGYLKQREFTDKFDLQELQLVIKQVIAEGAKKLD